MSAFRSDLLSGRSLEATWELSLFLYIDVLEIGCIWAGHSERKPFISRPHKSHDAEDAKLGLAYPLSLSKETG